jgi:endoglucanase
MKLTNRLNILTVAAVALLATACADTDAQYDIPDVAAPVLVSESPAVASDVLLFGEKVITVKFDKNIGFASKNVEKITLNGSPVKNAVVLGASTDLTITADVNFDKTQTLKIPAGLIVGPQGKTYDQDITLTWTINDLADNEATAMTKKLGWGWNMGNHFDTSGDAIKNGWGYWDGVTTVTEAPFKKLASVGAKTVRMPVTWTDHMGEGNIINADYLDEVAAAVDLAIGAGLNVILNTHHDSFETGLGSAADDAKVAKEDSTLIADLWKQVATRFASYGDQLIFETFNEVHAGDDWGTGSEAQFDLLNKWNQYAVDAIRSTGGNNATRWIGVSGYAANIQLTLDNLVLPKDPANHLMVGVHCYDPYGFCLHPVNDDGSISYNSWGHNADPAMSVAGNNEEYILALLYKLRTAYIEKGIPCYLGEYGCVNQPSELANAYRKYYLEFFCRAANLAGLPMFIWDNNSKGTGNEACGLLDHANGDWIGEGETLIPMMVQACTSTDSSYDFATIWNKSPKGN